MNLEHVAPAPKRKDYRIGAIGAGFIMSDCHLVAYGHAGYRVVAITSASAEESEQVAQARGIPKVYSTYQELLADPSIEVVDIAVPPDLYIKWRVEGTEGMAQGTIGWPAYPNLTPSTIDFTTRQEPGCWFSPRWKEAWFPDAFEGTMGQLLDALAKGAEPVISGRDNLKTVALMEAYYRSIEEHRPGRVEEILQD